MARPMEGRTSRGIIERFQASTYKAHLKGAIVIIWALANEILSNPLCEKQVARGGIGGRGEERAVCVAATAEEAGEPRSIANELALSLLVVVRVWGMNGVERIRCKSDAKDERSETRR